MLHYVIENNNLNLNKIVNINRKLSNNIYPKYCINKRRVLMKFHFFTDTAALIG